MSARGGTARRGLPSGALLVVRSGAPTPEEIAALVLALGGAVAAPARRRARLAPSRWLLAARRETLGAAPATSPADLRAPADVRSR